MRKPRLSYANVTASAAMFIALGGTAVAAATLERDSVGSPQIRKDAVRSAEIRDESVNLGDVSTEAQTALRGEVRVAEDDNERNEAVPRCGDLSECGNFLELPLRSGDSARTAPGTTTPGPQTRPTTTPGPQEPPPDRNWLVQAKLHVSVLDEDLPFGKLFECGLVNPSVSGPAGVLDKTVVIDGRENVALSAVVKKRARNPTIALRCTSINESRLVPSLVKMTALEVGNVTGP
jgi:hypothetical protein